MKKTLLFLTMALFSISLMLHAQQQTTVFIYDGSPVMRDATLCLEDDENVSVLVSLAPNFQPDTLIWGVSGDLAIVSVANDKRSLYITSTGPGIGAVSLSYSKGDCGYSSDVFYINKSFSPSKYNLAIDGPACVSPGDIVVYSVEPILTRNLGARVGVDHYYWNVNSANPPYFVDSLCYRAGDGSSVTFRVGDLLDNMPNEITLYVGECNNGEPAKKLTLPLVKQAPKPVCTQEHYCIPYGNDLFTMEISNPASDVQYTWEVPIGWSIDHYNNDSTIAYIRPNESDPGEVTISAVYRENNEVSCAITQSVIPVTRRWGQNVKINALTCWQVGDGYKYFSLKNGMPTKTPVRWEFNTNTWMIHPDDVLSNSAVRVMLATTAPLTDTVYVYEVSPCADADLRHDSLIVYIKPADVEISGPQCLEAGHSYTYTALRKNGDTGPMATEYEWKVNNNVVPNQTTAEAQITMPAGANYVTVRPLNHGCDGNTDTLRVMISPTDPTGLTWTDEHCINAGMLDSVKLSINGAVSTQSYDWDTTKTHNWHIKRYLTNKRSQAVFYTSGEAGKDTIEAYTSGQGFCQETERVRYIFTTDTVRFVIDGPHDIGWCYSLYCNPVLQNVKTYDWYFDNELQSAHSFGIALYNINQYNQIRLTVTFENDCQQTSILSLNPVNEIPLRKHKQKSVKMMELSPNPTTNEVFIHFSRQEVNTQILIFSLEGEVIYSSQTSDSGLTISTNGWPDGMYCVTIRQKGEVSSEMLIVKH